MTSGGGDISTVISCVEKVGDLGNRKSPALSIVRARTIGTIEGVEARHQRQWIETIRGYVVDAAEALVFVLLAIMASSLIPFDRKNPAYLWLTAALVLLALRRANQAIFFWGQFETYHGFELTTVVLLLPLCLCAWTPAWCSWFRLREHAWIPTVASVLTLLYMGSAFLSRSWFYGVFPHWVSAATRLCSMSVRWLFLLLTVLIIARGTSQPGREKWLVLPAIGLSRLACLQTNCPCCLISRSVSTPTIAPTKTSPCRPGKSRPARKLCR
jgi:hypothetical protein